MTANMSDMKKAMMETQSGEKVTSKTNILLQNTFSLICFSWNLPFQFLFTSESVGEGHPGKYSFSALQGISPLFSIQNLTWSQRIWIAELRIFWPFSYLCNHCSSIFWLGLIKAGHAKFLFNDSRYSRYSNVFQCLFSRQPDMQYTALTASASKLT